MKQSEIKSGKIYEGDSGSQREITDILMDTKWYYDKPLKVVDYVLQKRSKGDSSPTLNTILLESFARWAKKEVV